MAFNGSGAPLTSLNATNLASGTVPVARLGSSGTPSSSTYLRGDNTWASIAVRSGTQEAVFSSSVSSITLTASSAQYISIRTDGTLPVNQTIVLPNMTTLAAGSGYFTIANKTASAVGIASTDGTVREFIYAGEVCVLNISDVSSSNGIWNFTPVPNLIADNRSQKAVIASNYKVNASPWIVASQEFVVLNSNSFAHVWTEYSNNTQERGAVYAQLYTINLSTNAVTQGNRITLQAVETVDSRFYDRLMWDTTNNGQALVGWHRTTNYANTNVGFFWAALSVSSGTLYASAVQNRNTNGFNDQVGFAECSYFGYLGSNNAFALGYFTTNSWQTSNYYVEGFQITGTETAPTLTAASGNTSFAVSISPSAGRPIYDGSRTGLTTFSAWGQFSNTVARAITYTPASNSVSMVNRTTTTRLATESNNRTASSFGQGGFVYNTAANRIIYSGNFFDISNPGAAGVSVSSTDLVTVRGSTNTTSFSTPATSITIGSGRRSFVESGSNIVSVGFINNAYGLAYVKLNPSVATWGAVMSGPKNSLVFSGEGGISIFTATYAYAISTDDVNISLSRCSLATPF
jgi:hypothetical protein